MNKHIAKTKQAYIDLVEHLVPTSAELNNWLPTLCNVALSCSVHAQQPFLKYGVTVKVASLSNGRFQEFFTNDSLRRIGSVVYNARLRRVAYLLPPDSLLGHAKAEVTSRWMSPDPLAEKFMYV